VKSFALPEFWNGLNSLPPPVQKIARKNFKLWPKDPALKSLGFKKIKADLWSVRAGAPKPRQLHTRVINPLVPR
jgi:hypothetical protein